jgi:acetyl esterase/lipase
LSSEAATWLRREVLVTLEIPVWPGAAPGSERDQRTEDVLVQPDAVLVRNVVRPSLTPYLPDRELSNGTGVIVAPGGGFHFLAWDYEGTAVAEWLAAKGVTAFVLKYRLADTGPTAETFAATMEPVMKRLIDDALNHGAVDIDALVPEVRQFAYADGKEAVRLVRRRAAEWSVDPTRIGFLGFSAGAFVAAEAGVADDPVARPDFVAPIYGGQLAGAVPENAPPLFAVVAADDLLLRRTCIGMANAWLEAGRPTELHVYEQGGHGFGARKLGLPVDGWMDRLSEWMQARGLL